MSRTKGALGKHKKEKPIKEKKKRGRKPGSVKHGPDGPWARKRLQTRTTPNS